MLKKTLLIIILSVTVIFVTTIGLLAFSNKGQHRILTNKFYIPINESYEIVFFENENGNSLERYCHAELKVSESEYIELKMGMEEAGYTSRNLDGYDIYLENFSDWIPDEKVVAVYCKHILEKQHLIFSHRIQMDIFITESTDGYRQVYMCRN